MPTLFILLVLIINVVMAVLGEKQSPLGSSSHIHPRICEFTQHCNLADEVKLLLRESVRKWLCILVSLILEIRKH